MESDTSAEIIRQSTDIQHHKDACKESVLKKSLGVRVIEQNCDRPLVQTMVRYNTAPSFKQVIKQ